MKEIRSWVFLSLFVCASAVQKNVILIITDDQDVELGSLEAMPKVKKLLIEKGVTLRGYATTPICCPSRSSILTGLYAHNHNVHTNNQNCSGATWRSLHEEHSIGVYMQRAGYRTAYIGKYLNEYDGRHIPPGWHHWVGLHHNSRFYNYTLNVNGSKMKYGFAYSKDYLTDVVTNRSIDFISREASGALPFFIVISYPAPHGPEDPAPQHSHLFNHTFSHRTASWNYAPNPDKQWLLQRTGKMLPVHVAFTDLLQRRRLQTLQSVDDGVEKIVHLLREHRILSSSYLLYTSDHGYHVGQFGLIKGKNMPYEFDTRVPFLIRGPGLPRNATYTDYLVANIDVAPTILDMAGATVPPHMDGRSVLHLLTPSSIHSETKDLPRWRDSLLIERGKMPRMRSLRERLQRQRVKFGRRERVTNECRKKKWQQPCQLNQLFRCVRGEDGEWRVKACAERKGCGCSRRRRKERRIWEDNQDGIIDRFLRDAYNEQIEESGQWSQGEFALNRNTSVKSPRRYRRCSCGSERVGEFSSQLLNSSVADPLFFPDEEATPSLTLTYNRSISKKDCTQPQMSCFSHGSSHWRTPPLWPEEYGAFCFCQNSNNNTYWCIRTLNETHNFLYCEFVTEFVSFYNLSVDPFQLRNAVLSLSNGIIELLSQQLARLRLCRGFACNI